METAKSKGKRGIAGLAVGIIAVTMAIFPSSVIGHSLVPLNDHSSVLRGATAFATSWYYGSAVRLVYILKNTTGNYLTYLPPGSYSLIVHLSVYSLHLIYKQPLGQIVLSMPWTIVSTNYSGNSFLAWANQP